MSWRDYAKSRMLCGATPVTDAAIENGLLDLEQRSSRRAPIPRHPKRAVVVPPPPAPPPPTVVEVRESQPDQRPVPAREQRAQSSLRATQVYLDGDCDDFLRRCSAAGLIRGSRDVTNSGVIRYALGRLAAEMDPDDVALAMLDGGSPALRRPGRKRT